MIDFSKEELNVEEIMKKIKEEVRLRKEAKKKDAITEKVEKKSRENLPHSESLPYFEIKDVYKISDFVEYDFKNFINYAYKAILKREPSSRELHDYLSWLQQGLTDKEQVLLDLRYSPEGIKKGVIIEGLHRHHVIKKYFKIPLLGKILNILYCIVTFPRIFRYIKRLEYTLIEECMDLENKVRTIDDIMNMFDIKLDGLSDSLEKKAYTDDLVKKFNFLKENMGTLRETSDLLRRDTDALREDTNSLRIYRDILKGEADALRIDTDTLRENSDLLRRDTDALRIDTDTLRENSDLLRRDTDALREDTNSLRIYTDILKGEADALRIDTDTLREDADDLKGVLNIKEREIESIFLKIDEANKEIRRNKLALIDQERRLLSFLEEAGKRLPEPIGKEEIENMQGEEEHMPDAMYVSFEDQFRGTRENIKERQKVYLPYIKKIVQYPVNYAILDVGCGRGEWLELLGDSGYAAKGIDLNRVMIEECKVSGFNVERSDAIEYLRKQEPSSFSAITAFHLVEHLPLRILISLFDESLRVLRSGGIIICETPNPENLITGSCNFYIDPTHKNPIPPVTLKYLAEARGFSKVEIIRLHPLNIIHGEEEKNCKNISHRFNLEQDYSIVGYKL